MSIGLRPLLNGITTEAANACEIITAIMTFIKDIVSNIFIRLMISGRWNASINFPLCKYLFSNPAIKHRYNRINAIIKHTAIIKFPFA